MSNLMQSSVVKPCAELIQSADAVLIGAGAGLTAAAGINYTDTKKFADIFPGWVKKGFTMQYQLMGYPYWTQVEQWGYYAVHLDYVYFQQKNNALYQQLRQLIGDKDYFVMTSNVDQMFHKNGFDRSRIYSPQGSYGKIQCTKPCTHEVWDIEPYFQKMQQALDPADQVLTKEDAVPCCPNCGGTMFINARIDGSFIEAPYKDEYQRLMKWLEKNSKNKIVLLETGAGYNTPTVIRMPMENLASVLPSSTLIRVNMEHAEVSKEIEHKSISIQGDIKSFIEGVSVL
ncbi:NAD-dependent protein deacetylase of SIR2 family [Photobacterium lipolyticum]|uniref:NAD-dependent protein deacetylase of SIR2 family n=1 Tax=Photobacterium lipolyticum TaxID=266810 RepID=A0A2T3N3B8_9GAMM|nr:NAD-dependent protein deacetylase of SIR2 family [Photobacterium lipolyticum]PSW06765.1 NAD-dependent protein deacetylase of SIR2 family [Photobacterium lipolyticum]